MPEATDLTALYPDVVAHGSLAAAIRYVAAGHGSDLDLTTPPSDQLLQATASSVLPYRDPLVVIASPVLRKWSVTGGTKHGVQICGETDELTALSGVVHGWGGGASRREIAQAAPFDLLTGRYEVPDGNDADVTASEWQFMLKYARAADWPEFQDLVEAAYAAPELHKLYPSTQYWVLFFSSSWKEEFFPKEVCLEPPSDLNGGKYTLRESWSTPPLAQFKTPTEAVALAVRRVVEGLC